jgi:hypothetical protein
LGCDVLEVDAASVLVAIFCPSIFLSTSRLSSSIVCAIDLLHARQAGSPRSRYVLGQLCCEISVHKLKKALWQKINDFFSR